MADLFTKLMTKFIQKKYLIEKKDDKFIAKPFTLILNTDVANSNFHKEVNTEDIGTKAKSCFTKNLISDKKSGFKKDFCFFCYIITIFDKIMPFEMKLLKDIVYSPLKQRWSTSN